MSKPKFDPEVYAALRDRGHSNRQIAALLSVDESSVRRALREPHHRVFSAGLDPWPSNRPQGVLIVDTPEGSFVVAVPSGQRLLRLHRNASRDSELGRAVREVAQALAL